MRNIVKMVRDEMGGRAAYHARQYIHPGIFLCLVCAAMFQPCWLHLFRWS